MIRRGRVIIHESSSEAEVERTPSPVPRQRRSQRGTSRQPPPPNYDIERFTFKDNQNWFEEREHMEFIYEMHIAPEIDVVYRSTEAFKLLG